MIPHEQGSIKSKFPGWGGGDKKLNFGGQKIKKQVYPPLLEPFKLKTTSDIMYFAPKIKVTPLI